EALLRVLLICSLQQRDALQSRARLAVRTQRLLRRRRQRADPVYCAVDVLALIESLEHGPRGHERRLIAALHLRFELLERRALVEDGVQLGIELRARSVAEDAVDLVAVLVQDHVGGIAADL